MTADEVGALVAGRRIARHRGQVFFTVYTPAEADEWQARGARVVRETPGGHLVAEVHLAPLLDAPTEYDDEGELVDNRPDILLAYFRERDGFAVPPLTRTASGS